LTGEKSDEELDIVGIAAAGIDTWHDISITNVRDMPATDLVEHRIPTTAGARPRFAQQPLYTEDELQHQRNTIK